jgi:hypothetical protein
MDVNMKVLSNEPDDFIVGGLLSDVDLEVLEAKYTLDKPDKYPETAKPPLFVYFRMKDLTNDTEADHHWTSGSAADFVPSPDGNFCLPNPDNPTVAALRRGSNWFAMLQSLRTNGGMPKGFLNGPGGLSALKGLKFHAIQVPAPERPGLEKKDKRFPDTVLICSKILPGQAPWDKKGGTTRKAAAPAPAATQLAAAASEPASVTETGASGDADRVIAAALKAVIEASPSKSISADKTPNGASVLVYKALVAKKADNEVRKASVARLASAEWLEANGFLLVGETIVPAT